MTANIIFDNVRAYEVKNFDVRVGETFEIQLVDTTAAAPNAPASTVRWFADKDNVLQITEDNLNAQVKATNSGSSEIQLQVDGSTVLTLKVTVFNPDEAATLNASVGEPVLK